jgi:hypothetical protein
MWLRPSKSFQSSVTFTYACATANAVSGLGHDPGFTCDHYGRAIRNPHVVELECHIGEHLAFNSSGRYFYAAGERSGSGDADADYRVYDHCDGKQWYSNSQHNGDGESGCSNGSVHGAADGSVGGQQFGFNMVYLECDLSFD